MGNFSRNTYDPTKSYTSVRLQQGVPLVDADWNEQSDITRNELYSSLSMGFGDGFDRNGFAASMVTTSTGLAPNDFGWLSGQAMVGGRIVQTASTTGQYSKQPWTDPARAAADGTTVIPPLTTPTAARTDLVYLDVWEHEVGKAGDPNIVNPIIGVETAVRIRRDAAVRVAEGTTTLPTAPTGHTYLTIGTFSRTANATGINTDTMFHDLRVIVDQVVRYREVTYMPFMQTISGSPSWAVGRTNSNTISVDSGGNNALGVMPLRVPDRAQLVGLRYWASLGTAAGTSLTITVLLDNGFNAYTLATDTSTALGAGVQRFLTFQFPSTGIQPFHANGSELHVMASCTGFVILQQFDLGYYG